MISNSLSRPYWIVRSPIVSALWYAALIHLLFQPFSTISIIISSAILAISFLRMNSFYFGLLSPIPMIISLILLYLNFTQNAFVIFTIVGVVWAVLWVIFLVVMIRLSQRRYRIDIHNKIYEN